MSQITLTWLEFVKSAKEFLELSAKLGDNWTWQVKAEDEGASFLVYEQKVLFPNQVDLESETFALEKADDMYEPNDPMVLPSSINDSSEYLQVEYHIVYSISYQVPVLYFQAHKNDGSILQLEEAWKFFRTFTPATSSTEKTRSDMLSILTQTEHPVLFKPFLSLHPCRTAELLAQSDKSNNHVLTFISIMGPYVQLQLRNEYGLETQ